MKNSKSLKILIFGVLLPTILASALFADQKGTSTATFLRIAQGARAEGMGGAYTAVANDAHATYWNPAGLAQVTRRSLALNYLKFIEEINSQFASFALPVNSIKGTLGVGVTYVDYGSIERRDGTGATVGGDADVTSYATNVSWGQAFGDRFALGIGGKFINQDLAGETGSGFAVDLGALGFVIPNKLALGLSILNLGPQIKTGTRDEDLPQTITGGLAFYAIPEKLTLALDISKERDSDARLHTGFEYLLQSRFMVRAGYQDNQEAGGGLSAGLGFIWRPNSEGTTDFFGNQDQTKVKASDGLEIRFDYAYVDLGDFDETHRFGMTLAF
jgi:long-subunit fatty acid transport protein